LYGNLKKSDEIYKLLQALAFQIGSEVSYNELSSITGLSFKTVESYITVLEQAFVVFRLKSKYEKKQFKAKKYSILQRA
jgi:predicted AAA+ superfamily ATPase